MPKTKSDRKISTEKKTLKIEESEKQIEKFNGIKKGQN